MLERRQHVGIVAATFVACALAAAACGGDDATPVQSGTPDAATGEAGSDARSGEAGPDGSAGDGMTGDGNPISESGTGADGADAEGADAEADADAGLGAESGVSDGASTDSPSGGDGGCVSLDVKNVHSGCSVSVAGGGFSTSAQQSVCVAPGTIDLAAKVASNANHLGLWHHSAGDQGAGDPGTITGVGPAAQSATSVIVSGASACVWVCCPLVPGTGCPLFDQCP
jgi:hypothetical protein